MSGEKSSAKTKTLEFKASPKEEGLRLDLYLATVLKEISRSKIHQFLKAGLVSVNKKGGASKNYRLRPGDIIHLALPPKEETKILPEAIPLNLLYEDEHLLVLNKPRGMVVHPAPGHGAGTLVNALLHHTDKLSTLSGPQRPGIVHRLDKDTSGLLVAAKTDQAHLMLVNELKKRAMQRDYFALVHGQLEPAAGKIIAPVGRHPVKRTQMAITAAGKEAISRFKVTSYYKNYSLVKVSLETGRTHQIRVHMASIKHPVVGDNLYGRKKKPDLPPELFFSHALHAYALSFDHPVTKTPMKFKAPLPEDFARLLKYLCETNP